MAKSARQRNSNLPQPIFHEPVFSEGSFVIDPTGFATLIRRSGEARNTA
jgi:hypothetical protein